jgi:hypothetical protein
MNDTGRKRGAHSPWMMTIFGLMVKQSWFDSRFPYSLSVAAAITLFHGPFFLQKYWLLKLADR